MPAFVVSGVEGNIIRGGKQMCFVTILQLLVYLVALLGLHRLALNQ